MNDAVGITQPTPDNTFKKYVPILTIICCLVSVVLFIGINLDGKPSDWAVYKKWGAPSAPDIFNGSYWGLITSNFLHTELWHIAFNLYWFWYFGKKIEFESSKFYYGLLIISSALISSLSELAFANTTGIGLSGIGYAFFGFIFVKSKISEEYKNYISNKTTSLFIFWLLLCVVLSKTKIWNVGNAAHIGGFLWGMTFAYISRFDNYKQLIFGLATFSLLGSSVFWSPYSITWLSCKAYKLHKAQKVDEAIAAYKEILSRDEDNEFAKTNLQQLEIQKLEEKALDLHKKQQYREARQVYNQILSMDKDNQWVLENLKRLPPE